MTHQIIDIIEPGIPGATGDVTPEAVAARDQAVTARDEAVFAAEHSGNLASASAETVPADQPATVTLSGALDARNAHFSIPRGLPGVNALAADEAVSTYIRVSDSATHSALIETLPEISPTYSGTSVPVTVKPAGDVKPGVWEFESRGTSGYIYHLMARDGFTGGALMGLGLEADSQGGSALVVSMKSPTHAGTGISMADRPTVHGGSRMIDLYLQNENGARGIVMTQKGGGSGAALFVSTGAEAGEEQDLVSLNGYGFPSMKVKSKTGNVQFFRRVQVRTETGKLDLRAGSEATPDNRVDHLYGTHDTIEYKTYSGTVDTYFPKRIVGAATSLKFDVAPTTVGFDTAPAWETLMELKHSGGSKRLGFFGATPVPQQPAIGAPTGGTTIDTQSRAAIGTIVTTLKNIGLIAS